MRARLLIIGAMPLALSACALFRGHDVNLGRVQVTPTTGQSDALPGSDPVAAGRRQLAAGNFGNAIGAFRLALIQQPDSAAAANGLAIAYDAIGRPDLARRYFEQAMGSDPGNASYRRNYDRFAARMDAATVRLAAHSGANWPIKSAAAATPPKGQALVRLSLGEVKLRAGSEPRPAPVTAPKEVRLSLAGGTPRLDVPIERAQAAKQAAVSLADGSVDFARAVGAARMRAGLTTPIIDRRRECSRTAIATPCAS